MADGTPRFPGAPSILVADDEEIIRDLLKMVLSSAGYEVTCCASGQSALETATTQGFDVLICDFGLGDLDAISLHRQLAQSGNSLAQHMILVTGEVADPTVDSFLEQTGLPALQKPFDTDTLAVLIQEISGSLQQPGARARH